MVIRRGEIWWASLPEPVGSEPGERRPLLVLQADDFNRSKIKTIIGVVVTSNLTLAQAPGNVFLPRKATHLDKDSVANVSQIMTADKQFLTERVSSIPPFLLEQVENGVLLVLGLR